jgi:hypothetical protein
MIASLRALDRTAAAGLLARAALSLGYEDSPIAPFIKGEEKIRSALIDEARQRLGVERGDNRPETIERIADFLDDESDKLLAPPDTEAALARLAERGDLPSDLYEIEIIPNVIEFYGKDFPLEKEIIKTTIQAPTLEQHFGPPRKPHEPAMISLFARTFRTRWPLKDFVMLVAAQREGFRLHVHQAWRIYSSRVDVKGVKTPVDWLSRFADAYGAEIEVEGKKGHFFLFTTGYIPTEYKVPLGGGKPGLITISRFTQKDPVTGIDQSALVVAIDLVKYGKMLDALRVKREDILEEFVRPPRATA